MGFTLEDTNLFWYCRFLIWGNLHAVHHFHFLIISSFYMKWCTMKREAAMFYYILILVSHVTHASSKCSSFWGSQPAYSETSSHTRRSYVKPKAHPPDPPDLAFSHKVSNIDCTLLFSFLSLQNPLGKPVLLVGAFLSPSPFLLVSKRSLWL